MDDFIKASQFVGNNILYVQGAGGNTSIKLGNKLYVKASGEKLKNMSLKNGYVCCRYKFLSDYFKNKKKYTKQDEHNFLQLVDSSIIRSESFGFPSMEAGFHAVIRSKYIFHLHSVYANIFGCMKYGSHFIKQIFTDMSFLILDYANPGYELAFLLSKKNSLPPVIFLKNHGIIVHGKDSASCLHLIEQVHEKIETYLKMKKVMMPFKLLSKIPKMKEYTFPDSAVFSNINLKELSLKKQKEVLEIISAQQYTINIMKRLGYKPSFLTTGEINKILGMKQEKYRQELFKK